ncbi:hypothetical protein ACFZAO_05725 [Streptomyces griseoaurantiacus]|uniref:hypothetical protein n=1 Tax=Streptomyces griseoaurantiacus TaxID=68213 RepID=UPI0036EBF6AA
MNTLDMDPGLAAIIDYVREVHGPITHAVSDGTVTTTDCAYLVGAVDALLRAIDARLPQDTPPTTALKAVA